MGDEMIDERVPDGEEPDDKSGSPLRDEVDELPPVDHACLPLSVDATRGERPLFHEVR